MRRVWAAVVPLVVAMSAVGVRADFPAKTSLRITLEKATLPEHGQRDEGGYALLYNAAADPAGQGNLELLVTRHGGQWDATCAGVARTYNLGLHLGRVEVKADGPSLQISVKLAIAKDSFGSGGEAQYAIQLKPQGEGWAGTYQGTFAAGGAGREGKAVQEAASAVAVAWPTPVAGHQPLKPAEHPRLLFRNTDVAKLQERAASEDGKLLITRLKELLALDKDNHFGWGSGVYTEWAPAYCEGPWAVGHAFLAALGDKDEAAHAKRVTQVAMDFKGGEWGGWGRAHNLLGIALAYDMCYDQWDGEFRQKVADFLSERAGAKAPKADAAWDAMFNSAGGMAALAIMGDPEDRKNVGTQAAADTEQFIYWYQSLAVGEKGFLTETLNNGDVVDKLLPLCQAFRTALGRDLARGTGLEWIIPLTFFTRNRFMGNDWGDEYWPTMAFPGLVSNEYCSAIKWHMRKHTSRAPAERAKRNGVATPDFCIALPSHAAFAMVSYPWDAQAVEPKSAGLPLSIEDKKFGAYALRNSWDDPEALVATFRAQSNAPRASVHAGTFTLSGLSFKHVFAGGTRNGGGTFTLATINTWEERPCIPRIEGALPLRGGAVTFSKLLPDGSASISMLQDYWVKGYAWGPYKAFGEERGAKGVLGFMTGRHGYLDSANLGIKQNRSFAVDFSRKSGADCLIALVDRFEGVPGGMEKFLQFPLCNTHAYDLTSQGNTFTLGGKKDRKGQPDFPLTMTGAFIAPRDVKIETNVEYGRPAQVLARGGDEYFLILTIQKNGMAPRIDVTGAGLDARVKIGEQAIRFTGGNIVVGNE